MAADTTARKRRRRPRQRHVPQRTCVACREVDDKRAYTRLVRTPERTVEVDPTGKANGRGAYLHRSRRCWRRALDSGAIAAALKVELNEQDRERLWTYARTHFPPDGTDARQRETGEGTTI